MSTNGVSRSGDERRLFLQAMLARKILSLPELREVITVCHEKYQVPCIILDDDVSLMRFIADVNGVIMPFNMRIKHVVDEDNGQHSYALVNLRDDELSKSATMFSGNEATYYKRLVHQIVESDTGSISSTEALNIAGDLDSCRLSADAAESSIERWLELGCLKQDGGRLSLSPLGLAEMETYLKQEFGNELRSCHMCRQICIKGQTCANQNCNVKLHHHCADKVFCPEASTVSGCPQCSFQWRK